MASLRDFLPPFLAGRPKNPAPPPSEIARGERIITPNRLMNQFYDLYPFDTGLLTSTGKTMTEEKSGLKIFEEMSRDPQVVASNALKRTAVLDFKWELLPFSSDARDIEIAEFVTFVLKDLLGETAMGLDCIGTAFNYGRSVSEIIYEPIKYGKYAGNYTISALKPKNIGMIDFKLDKFNNITAFKISQDFNGLLSSNETIAEVKPFKVLHWAWNGDFDNPYGKADLASVWPWYWAKKTLYKFAMVYGEKYASPIPEINAERQLTEDEKKAIYDAIANFQISNGIMTPRGTKLTLHQNSGTGGAFYKSMMDAFDSQIARSILAQTLTTNENQKTGTFAQADVHESTLERILKRIRHDVAKNVVQKQLVKRLVDLNYGQVEGYPQFRFDRVDPEFLRSMAESFKILTEAKDAFGNAILDPKEDFVREFLELPDRDVSKFPYRDKPVEAEFPPPAPFGGGGAAEAKPGEKPKPAKQADSGKKK